MSALLAARKVTVLLRRLPGTYPLIDAIRKLSYGRGEVTVSDFDGSLRMQLDLAEHMASQIFWFGYYSRDLLQALDALLQSGDVFLDAGANIGEVSLFAAKRVGPAGRVCAFEPLPDVAPKLRANVRLNGFRQVEIIEAGLGDRCGEEPIYMRPSAFDDGSRHDGLGTLYASDERSRQAGTVRVTTLDQFVSERGGARVDGIKLDIEGAELAALRGAASTIERFRPWLIVEIGEDTCRAAGYEPLAIFDFLDEFGYEYRR
ncbi:MAG: FkbM family methyltransferase, partial [Pseudomonadota bacterium]